MIDINIVKKTQRYNLHVSGYDSNGVSINHVGAPFTWRSYLCMGNCRMCKDQIKTDKEIYRYMGKNPNRICRSVSTKILEEDGYTLSEILSVECNTNTINIFVHTSIHFRGKKLEHVHICKQFSGSRRRISSEIIKNRIREIIENKPDISSLGVKRETGYCMSTINKYYMLLKKIYR